MPDSGVYKGRSVRALSSQEVGLEARIAALVRPEGKGNGRQIVDDRHGVSVLRQINGSQIKLAGVAALHANVRKLLRHVHRQFLFVFLAASRAKNSPEVPLLQTKGTQQPALPAVAFLPQDSQQRSRTAARADPVGCGKRRLREPPSKKLRVRLQKRAEHKFLQRLAPANLRLRPGNRSPTKGPR